MGESRLSLGGGGEGVQVSWLTEYGSSFTEICVDFQVVAVRMRLTGDGYTKWIKRKCMLRHCAVYVNKLIWKE